MVPAASSVEKISAVFSPLADFARDRCSVTAFAKNPKKFTDRSRVSGRPILLTQQAEVVAIVCAPENHLEIETRRSELARFLTSDHPTGDWTPRLAKAKILPGADDHVDAKLRELGRCKEKIEWQKEQIASSKEYVAEFENELAPLERRFEMLLEELKSLLQTRRDSKTNKREA